MDELIPINTNGGKLTVSARALHDFLKVEPRSLRDFRKSESEG